MYIYIYIHIYIYIYTHVYQNSLFFNLARILTNSQNRNKLFLENYS